MGGRGAKSGSNSLASIRRRYKISGNPLKANSSGIVPTNPGYDGGGNPQLIKYQGQDEDKTARYLAKVWNNTDFANYPDGKWSYHDNSYQKLVLNMGLNNKPTVMDDASFNALQQQTGAAVVYRGWKDSDSADRFEQSKYFHTGGGIYGDGIYFSTSQSVAASYSRAGYGKNAITKMMLSPNAKVVDIAQVRSAIRQASSKLQTGLSRAGQAGQQNGYGGNKGESQMALKMGYNVIKVSDDYYVGLSGDAFIVSKKRY